MQKVFKSLKNNNHLSLSENLSENLSLLAGEADLTAQLLRLLAGDQVWACLRSRLGSSSIVRQRPCKNIWTSKQYLEKYVDWTCSTRSLVELELAVVDTSEEESREREAESSEESCASDTSELSPGESRLRPRAS